MDKSNNFKKMVDWLIENCDGDIELKAGLNWIDKQAQKKDVTFYDMMLEVIYKHEVNLKAKKWLNDK